MKKFDLLRAWVDPYILVVQITLLIISYISRKCELFSDNV